MKTTFYLALFLAFSFVISFPVSGQELLQQEQNTTEEMAAIETESMSMQLNESLSAEQTEELMQINMEFFTNKKELKERLASDQEFMLLYQTREDLVKSVLTEEQFNIWKENPAAQKIRQDIEQIVQQISPSRPMEPIE